MSNEVFVKVNAQVNDMQRYVAIGETHKIFNIAKAYLKGLEDAGAITKEESDELMWQILGGDE